MFPSDTRRVATVPFGWGPRPSTQASAMEMRGRLRTAAASVAEGWTQAAQYYYYGCTYMATVGGSVDRLLLQYVTSTLHRFQMVSVQ